MNDEIKVSIIIPVWSMPTSDGSLLRRAFDCCVNQTMQEIEIIAINDKSPNKLDYNIMEEYSNNYPNKFRCLYLQENLRPGGARNRGLEIAQGEYVMFMDNDDTMDHTICEKLYNESIMSDADIVACNWFNAGRNEVGGNGIDYFVEGWICYRSAPWSRIVRRRLFEFSITSFIEEAYLEDISTYLWAIYSRKTVFIDEVLYSWQTRAKSLSLGGSLFTNSNFTLFFPAFRDFLCRMDAIKEINSYTYTALFIFNHIVLYIDYYYEAQDTENKMRLYEQFKSLFIMIDLCRLSNSTNTFSSLIMKRYRVLDANQNMEQKSLLFTQWIKDVRLALSFDSFGQQILNLCQYLTSISMADLCLWGSGKNGSMFARVFSYLSIPTEVTDIDPKAHYKVMPNKTQVKPWQLIKDRIKTILVCTSTHYKDVKDVVGDNYLTIDLYSYLSSGLLPREYLLSFK